MDFGVNYNKKHYIWEFRMTGNSRMNFVEGAHLCRASGQGDLGLVKSLVEVLDVPVDSKDRCGRTALHCASINGHTKIVQYLLEKGANPRETEDHYNGTALHMFASRSDGDVDIMRHLVKKGALVDAVLYRDTVTPLHLAAQAGNTKACRYLLAHGALCNVLTSDMRTPFYLACQKGHTSTVALLLDKGAGRFITRIDGVSPMLVAWMEGQQTIVKFLNLIDVRVQRRQVLGDVTMKELHTACLEGQVETVKTLLDQGADVNAESVAGMSPLHAACWKGHLPVVDVLVGSGANVNAEDDCKGRPLHFASFLGSVDIVKILLDHGAAVDSQTATWQTALYKSCWEKHTAVVELLLQHKADVHITDIMSTSSLMLACDRGHEEAAKALLKAGANINEQRVMDGKTPLIVACCGIGHNGVVQVLLEHGGLDCSLRDHRQNTYSSYCYYKEHYDILRQIRNFKPAQEQKTPDGAPKEGGSEVADPD